MKSISVKQIQKLDKIAIEKYGVPSIALMENAGRSVAHEVIKLLKGRKPGHVCVICGLGNNAGDGFVVARHLSNAGVRVKILFIGKANKLKFDAAINYRILKKLKYNIKEVAKANASFATDIKKADIVVDAVFGVGLNRQVLDPFKSVIESLNENARRIVSVDVPSGLDGTSGKVYDVCVKAYMTVTFSFAKKGFFKGCGSKHTGKVVVADIGIPLEVLSYKL